MFRKKEPKVKIVIDDKSGFCTGVVRAVRMAEEYLGQNGQLYSLGPLVHNRPEVKRLEGMGLESISYEEFNRLDRASVLIRAHGEPPSTYRKAEERNIQVLDATCPIVRRLQDRIRETYQSLKDRKGSILIFGKPDHPEVRSLLGQTKGRAMVVRNPEEIETLRPEPPLTLFSQTTMKTSEFDALAGSLREYLRKKGWDPEKDLHVNNTICKQVSSREPHLRRFAPGYDLILFVSGKQSSNGRALFGVCKEVNANSHFISAPSEIEAIDIEGIESIGICGATSTPLWQMEEVRRHIEERIKITSS
jgi:4-hydroxy-3-methylbut-2-enyl diphosphate reductase